MGYIGNQTTNAFSSMQKQDITGNGGASYTLSTPVANSQEIEVFVNNVRQEPGIAYTASGTALTMTGNVESTDDFYVVYQGKAVQTATPTPNSVGITELAVTDGTEGQFLSTNGSGTLSFADVAAGGGFTSMQVFTSSGTWTKPEGISKIKVYVVGGGGAGGTVKCQDSGSSLAGAGGSAGGCAIKVIDVSEISSETVTIGAGGTAIANVDTTLLYGNSGGTSSFGSHCSATGGGGGGGLRNASQYIGIGMREAGGVGSNGDINIKGQLGEAGEANTVNCGGGNGGSSFFQAGGAGGSQFGVGSSSGSAGSYGSGGGGGATLNNDEVNAVGGAGGAGIVVVEEYT